MGRGNGGIPRLNVGRRVSDTILPLWVSPARDRLTDSWLQSTDLDCMALAWAGCSRPPHQTRQSANPPYGRHEYKKSSGHRPFQIIKLDAEHTFHTLSYLLSIHSSVFRSFAFYLWKILSTFFRQNNQLQPPTCSPKPLLFWLLPTSPLPTPPSRASSLAERMQATTLLFRLPPTATTPSSMSARLP